jgi:hypothetical protein
MVMRKLAAIAGILAVLTVLVGGTVGIVAIMVSPWAQSSGPRPTDAQMIAHWRAQRPVLERLVGMLQEDPGLKRLGKDWSEPEDPASIGLSVERIALYRQLLRDAGIISLVHYGGQIEFVYYTAGIYIRGSAKSFCYGPPPDYADKIDGDLDQAREGLRRFTLQRRIEGDWWLQYEGT